MTTNYNQKQTVETQLGLPGIGLEDKANSTVGPNQSGKKGLRARTYGIIGAVALAISGAVYGVNYTLNEMKTASEGVQAFGRLTDPERIAEKMAKSVDDYFDKHIWKNTGSGDYADRYKTKNPESDKTTPQR